MGYFGLRIADCGFLKNKGQLNDFSVGAAFQPRSCGFNDLNN
jgi:hypothetical protein